MLRLASLMLPAPDELHLNTLTLDTDSKLVTLAACRRGNNGCECTAYQAAIWPVHRRYAELDSLLRSDRQQT